MDFTKFPLMPVGLAARIASTKERLDIGDNFVFFKAQLADAGVDIAAFIGAKLDLAGFEVLDRLG